MTRVSDTRVGTRFGYDTAPWDSCGVRAT